MKNSLICCAATDDRPRAFRRLSGRFGIVLPLAMVLLGLLLWAPAGEARAAKKDRDPAFLIQPFLSPEFAQWLIGPIARIATDEEIEAYLRLQDDEAAAEFIEAFWARRDPFPEEEGNPVQELYEERAKEVDSRYGETLYRGRHTDRGTLYILYGPPEEVDREVAPYYGGEALEIWRYPKKAKKGLDDEKPKRVYRFMRHEDRTIFYNEALISRKKKAADRIPRLPRHRG